MAESSPAAAAAASVEKKSDEQTVEMLDRMLTRLALCDDSKLEALLSKLLPLSISTLSSQSVAVRNKVIELLSHVNKRVKHQLEVGFPCLELWKMYVEDNAAPMVKNFCIVYIEMAFDRIHVEEKETMAPILLASISKLPSHHQEIILRIIIKVIGECHSSRIDDEVAEKYRSISGSTECDIFLEFGLHTILYTPPSQGGESPASLSITQCKRVTGKYAVTSDMLLMRKLGILNIVETMKLAPELVYSLYLAACVDCQGPVAKRGEELLKRVSDVNLEDVVLINRLLLLCNGTAGAENIGPESKITPASSALRVKLMSTFCRSIKAANSFPSTLQCIFGCIYGSGTTSRLKQLGMEFTVWVFKHASVEQLKLMGPVILTGILKSLDSYSNSGTDALARDTKTFAFQAIGLLAQRMPQLFRGKIDMAIRLFNALKSEPQFLRQIVQEATNSLATAYKGAPAAVLKDLEALLLENAQVEQSEVRFCAVRWATSLFDMQHCPTRFICMLGAADSKLDIREMALEGLSLDKGQGQSASQNLNPLYPKLGNMLGYIIQQQPELSRSNEMREQKLLFPSNTFLPMLKFLMKCFEADVEQNKYVGATSEFCSYVETMCLLLEHAMVYEGSVELHAVASKSLITVGAHVPQMVSSRYAAKISWLKQLLGHIDVDTRECAARMLGIASGSLPISVSSNLIEELISSIGVSNKSRFEMLHGVLSALGYVAADCRSRTPTIPETLLQSSLRCLVNVVNSETAILASVAMEAIGHVGLRGPLPLLVHECSSEAILAILLEKLKKILSGDYIKAIQKTVISLGHICSRETLASHLQIALDLIFGLCRSKVEDVLFAAGEALSFMWGGVPVTADAILKSNYTSLSMISNFLTGDVSPTSLKHSSNEESQANEDGHIMVREAIITKLFNVLLYSSRKEERCAGTVWLLSLTMYCGHHPTIQQLLPEIQEAFSHLLGEQNELTQELASQGMSIVYEIGDASMKKNLVNALVGTLTGSGKRKRVVKLVEDSEVFQDGAIGESPSGGKLSTYKELCGLANDMGQPDLIYKFMDLANYQASLNSKRGAAFGFSKIAKQAGDALQPHLHVLIPRLVRYQYDPDKNVQDAMAHIWKSLVADPKRTIDGHLDLIIDDLLLQCGSRLWRSREASCLALADIIQGRKFDQVGKHLKRIWTATFRAMDDIKESVRNSGDKLCRSLTSLTIRLCDFALTDAQNASQAMDTVLPLLLAEGIMSKVESIRKASIATVMKLAKGAGAAIRPHLPDLVCCMLESLSSLEDQGLNYVELHAAKVGIQTDKLENLRISMAKGSPMWETLDMCVDFVQSQSLERLVPRLAHLVRSGVGLNTRVGVASFINLLVQKVNNDIKPFTGMLLKLLFPVVKEEKSIASKRAFANACAQVLKYAAPSQVQKLIEETASLHNGDRNCQISCAVLLKCYSSNAADVLSGYHAVIFPVIFVARFEDDKYVSGLFEELWEDNTSGERITLQLYLEEIVSLVCDCIAGSSWGSKRKSALAISKLSEVLGESLSPYNHVLVASLMKELPGRLWEGKDSILCAIGALCSSCHKAISNEDPASPSAILHAVSSACTKKVKKYREAALSCLEQVIKAFADPEFFNLVFPLLFEMCNSATPMKSGQALLLSDAGTTDETEDASASHDKVLSCITSCISIARMSDVLEQGKNLMHVLSISLSAGFPWTVKMSAFSLIKEVCSRLHDTKEPCMNSSTSSFVHELFHSPSRKVVECMRTVKIAQVHIAASECLVEMCNAVKLLPSVQWTDAAFKGELLNQYESEKSEQAKSSLKKCISILESIDQETSTELI